MTSTDQARPWPPGEGERRDAGATLVEVLVAMVVFGIVVSSVLVGLNLSVNLSRDSRNRVAATNLAARELEITRNQFGTSGLGPASIPATTVTNGFPLPGGSAGSPLVVDDVAYTVTRSARWSGSSNSTASACDGATSEQLAYLHVHVEVTWPRMGSTRPVVSDTVLTPSRAILSGTNGVLTVKVTDRDAAPGPGHRVTASGPSGSASGTTDEQGCVTFPSLASGTYTVSLGTAGYVDKQGSVAPTRAVGVTAGRISRGFFDYDRAAALVLDVVSLPGHARPAQLTFPYMVASPVLLPNGLRRVDGSGYPRTLPGLYPDKSGYGAWVLNCQSADPNAQGGTRQSFATDPGATTTGQVQIGAVDVRTYRIPGIGSGGGGSGNTGENGIGNGNGNVLALPGATVLATATCLDEQGQTMTVDAVVGVTGATGQLRGSLPYGTWKISIQGRSPVPAWPSVTLAPGPTAQRVDVVAL